MTISGPASERARLDRARLADVERGAADGAGRDVTRARRRLDERARYLSLPAGNQNRMSRPTLPDLGALVTQVRGATFSTHNLQENRFQVTVTLVPVGTRG